MSTMQPVPPRSGFRKKARRKLRMRMCWPLRPCLDEVLNLHRLTPPTAPAEDPRWQGTLPPGEVVVAARSAGDARIVAAGGEVAFSELNALPAEDVPTRNASVSRDEKIYTVIEIEHGCKGFTRGVFEGDVSMCAIRPLQADRAVEALQPAVKPAYGSTK